MGLAICLVYVIQLFGAGANIFLCLRKALLVHVPQFNVKSPRGNLELYIYFHIREKLLTPTVWRAVVKADTELVVLAPSCLPVLREAGEWYWQAVPSSELVADWDYGDSCEQAGLKGSLMLDSGEPLWCSCHQMQCTELLMWLGTALS